MRTMETESRCRTESYGYHMAIAFSYGAQVAFPERWVSALQTGPQGTHLSRLMAVACCCQQWGDPWGSEEIDQKQKGMYRGILYNYVVLCIYIIQYYTWNSLSHVIYNHMYIYIYDVHQHLGDFPYRNHLMTQAGQVTKRSDITKN